MQNKSRASLQNKNEIQGVLWGIMAVVAFSVTLPATRLAVAYIDPTVVGVGRSFFVSFPAIVGAILLKQKPSYDFWIMAMLGSGLVIVYLMLSREGHLQTSEFILLGASILCAIGYAQGGKLAHEMGGLAVICWALVLSAPVSFSIIITKAEFISTEVFFKTPWQAWLSFFYLSIISQWIAFIMWYKGLALGGVVRVSQVQLVQPFFTLIVSAVMLDESISVLMIVFAIAVVITVGVGRRMPVSVID